MRQLCSLIVILFSSQISFAMMQQMYTQYQMQSNTSLPSIIAGSATSNVKSTDQTMEYRAQEIADLVSIAAGVTVSQPDYSSYIVRNRFGVETPLNQNIQVANEIKGTTLVSVARGPHTGSVRWTGSMSETPLPSQKVELSFEEGFLSKSTLIGAEYSYQKQSKPLTYFIDRDFQTKARAETTNTSSVGIYYEQIISQKVKNMVKATTTLRAGERPRNYGVEDRIAVAPIRRLYLQTSAGYFSEDKNEPLLDERGYFSLVRAEFTATYEPIYDLLVSASYGLLAETEYEPRTDTKTRLGTDQYGLGVQYTTGDWQLNIKGSYFVAKTGNGGSALGGVTWSF